MSSVNRNSIGSTKNILIWFLFIIYLTTLIYIVFLARRRQDLDWDEHLINLLPLIRTIKYLKLIHHQKDFFWWFFSNVIGNIVLFVPVPFFANFMIKGAHYIHLFLIGLGCSLLIEILQFLLRRGIPDIDDVILNATGVVIGIFLVRKLKSNKILI